MAIICPTITAYDLHEYRRQANNVSFAERIHVDLMDGLLAPTQSPELSRIWLPPNPMVDIHLMYRSPMNYLGDLVRLHPHMVVIHAEADVDHMYFVAELHKQNIQVGLALLQDTPIEDVEQIIHSFDHVLIFSGNLGHHGGTADLTLTNKVRMVRAEHPSVEIGWDGGINDENAAALVEAGVDVLNVGGFIQKSDDSKAAYDKICTSLL